MSTLKRYTITTEQAEVIREALSTCDGDWWVAVRWGEDWTKDGLGTLFGSDGVHVQEGIKGVEIALCFSPETTILGAVHKVLECSEIHGIRIEGNGRNKVKITDLTQLQDCTLLEKLTLRWCVSLVDISPLSSLKNLTSLTLVMCRSLVDISALSSLSNLTSLTLVDSRSLVDISALSSLSNLTSLTLWRCRSLVDISSLSSLKNLQTLNLGVCKSLVDISPLASLQNLHTIDLSSCDSLVAISPLSSLKNLHTIKLGGDNIKGSLIVDISSLSSLSNLQTLELSRCMSIEDISALSSLQNLHTIKLDGCESLVDISPLSSLKNLHTIDLSSCDSLVDISPLSSLQNLQILDISGDDLRRCSLLVDISPLSSLKNLHALGLSRCGSLVDISPLSSLQNLQTLNVNGCSSLVDISLANLPSLHTLELSRCDSLVDISALSSLHSLQTLSLGSRSLVDISPLSFLLNLTNLDLSGSLVDISPLSSLKNLQTLNVGGCSSLVDISLANLPSLHTLELSSCSSLVDISLANLPSLHILELSRCSSLVDISLANLPSLHTLELSSCSSLVDISALSSLQSLQTLNLRGSRKGSSLVDISPLNNLSNLQTLDLSDCNELADNRTWKPLTTLPSLQELKGSFPSYFTTKILARNAANNQDREYIRAHLSNWIQTAESSPTEPNLLTQVGRACAVHPDGYESLATIISLSTTNDAPEIDELFATAIPLASHKIIGSAIQSAVDQSEQPLPPETMVALHNHLPNNTTLRDNTIIALARSISQDTVPEWGEKTAKALREELNDIRYPITTSIHDEGLSVLAKQQFTPIQSHFFGVLCSGHARSTDIEWRNHFHNLLCGLALSQKEAPARNQALSDISAGLAICGDTEWVQERLDYLLKAAAEIDPDTSVLYAAVAHAHATSGRWDEAKEIASGIASPSIRDASLNKLCTMVLASNLPDKMQRAISFVNALSEPIERAQKLYDLGFHDGLLEDLVAYGQLVGLLTEFPEKQKEVVAQVTEKKPEMVDSPIQTVKPNIQARQWLDLIQRVAPKQYEEILSEYEKNPF